MSEEWGVVEEAGVVPRGISRRARRGFEGSERGFGARARARAREPLLFSWVYHLGSHAHTHTHYRTVHTTYCLPSTQPTYLLRVAADRSSLSDLDRT